MNIGHLILVITLLVPMSCVGPFGRGHGGTPPGGSDQTSGSGAGVSQGFAEGSENVVAMEVKHGNDIYINSGCATCHRIGDEGGSIGPDLTGVGRKLNLDDIMKLVKDPQSANPKGTMPSQDMPEQDLRYLARYLSMLK